jgi:hypothetical protein
VGWVSWVGGLFKSAAGKVTKAIEFIPHAFVVLWHLLQALGRNVGGAWHRLYTTLAAFGQLVDDLGRQAYLFGHRLIYHTIPDAIRHVLSLAAAYASKLAAQVKAWAVSAYKAALAWASKLVAELRGWVSSAVKWLTGLIAQIRATLAHVARIVDTLLTHPERLVTWILPALLRAVLRLAVTLAKPLARLVLREGVPLILRAIPDIEAVFADIL